MSSWGALREELLLWHQQNLLPTLWWRDDDAQIDTPALRRLSQLSLDYQVPLHLAVIPQGAASNLNAVIAENSILWVFQHGFSHQNHATASERKCELGDHRPLTEILTELDQGRQFLELLLDQPQFVPVLVPPWNRCTDKLLPYLSEIGFIGSSTFGPKPRECGHDLTQMNVHIDIIDWKTGCFVGDQQVVMQLVSHLQGRRLGRFDLSESTGLMTHHLAHDEQCWDFCRRLFELTEEYGVQWQQPSQLFPI